jgi:hypothetical protein
MKDRKIVDVRHLKSTGIDFVKETNEQCESKFKHVLIFSPEIVPSRLLITREQFKELARLNGDPETNPTGKELFKTREGYVLEIKVDGYVKVRK